MTVRVRVLLVSLAMAGSGAIAPAEAQRDQAAFEAETMRHFQALLRLDTTSPPGREIQVVQYLERVFDKEGIPYQVFARTPERPNIVARVKGNGSKRPVLVMGHTDVVTVDPKKWSVPPFAAIRTGGYVYGRGAVDDKDSVVAGLMLLLTLKRSRVALDRDVVFLAESGEEGSPDVGAQFMIDEHFDAIDAEYCLAEGGGAVLSGGRAKFFSVGTTEKNPRPVELVARGPSGHGSVPLTNNAIARLAAAVATVAAWRPPLRVNETTNAYFRGLAAVSSPELAQRYRDVLSSDPRAAGAADAWLLENEPEHWSMLHTSLVPTSVEGGYRYNVIPSEARAIVDTRLHPDEDQRTFLDRVRQVVADPGVEVRWLRESYRPPGASRIDTEAFAVIEAQVKRHYDTVALPTMGTGASDKAQLRSKGVQCYGIGPAVDSLEALKGFGAHSDQERILESELHRFVRFQRDVVMDLARVR